ncbi:MAG TPA: nitrate reductase molybdenum cofactor assembly chaperone [Gaiellaceae bacterium]
MTARAEDGTPVLALLAALLAYPDDAVRARALEAARLVAEDAPEAAELLERFAADVEALPPGRLEELYSAAFDLDTLSVAEATCYPYVGHHLFGESYRRSRFMVGLLERYRADGFEVDGGELPDHLLVMLRFLARDPDPDVAEEIVGEALLPALGRMTCDGDAEELEGPGGRRMYLRLLEAVRRVLGDLLWPDTPVCSYDPALVAAGGARSVAE